MVGEDQRGNNSQQAVDQNKNGNRADERDEFPSGVMRNIFVEKIAHAELQRIGEQKFADLLESAGTFHGKAALQIERADGHQNQRQ